MTAPEFRAPVVLRCRIIIDGQAHTAQEALSPDVWALLTEPERAAIKGALRDRLGAAVMARLDPPVTVHEPGPAEAAARLTADEEAQREAARQARARCHAVNPAAEPGDMWARCTGEREHPGSHMDGRWRVWPRDAP